MSVTDTSTARNNARMARTVYELFNQGKIEEACSYATDDVELNLYPFNQHFTGREGFASFMLGFQQAFPDLLIEVTHQVADDKYVTNELRAKGTHNGPLMTPNGPIPATGKEVNFIVCEVWGIRDGKMASLNNYQDSASILRQLGLIE